MTAAAAPSRPDRRAVLKVGGGLAAAGLSGVGAAAAGSQEPRTRLSQFDYADVELLDGPARRQFDETAAALMAMDEDALLKPFRQAANLPAPGQDLGGWYNRYDRFIPGDDMRGFIPGHSLGQYISSLARAHAVTGDAAMGAKARRLVAGLAPTFDRRFYDGYNLPAYTYDKIVVGLIDAHAHAADRTALKLLGLAIDAVIGWLPERALTRAEMRARPHPNAAHTWDEAYTLPENLYRAWSLGAGERYRTMARRYLHDRAYFDPLAVGQNVLPGNHAYSHVNALASAMQAYLIDGEEKHLRAAQNGLRFVEEQSFATGGWGPNESFQKPGEGALGKSLSITHRGFETACGTYGHFKVARNLMRVTGESHWGDAMERQLFNAALGMLPLKPDGGAFYYSDYNDTGAKNYFEYNCPCCSGTIGQLTADYGISSYLHDADGIYVNLYLPSRVRWSRGSTPVTLTQQTGYPLLPTTTFTVTAPRPTRFAIRLRIPAWVGAGTRVAVNGKAEAIDLIPGRFAEIAREWRDGDRIELAFDMPLRLEAVDAQTPRRVALMQGPLALFQTGDRMAPFRRAELLAARQDSPGAPGWTVAMDSGQKRFEPFFAIPPGRSTRLYQFVAD